MDLQHRFIGNPEQRVELGAVQPGGQGGDRKRQAGIQPSLQCRKKCGVDGQFRGGAVVVDFNAGQCDAGASPGVARGYDPCRRVRVRQGIGASVQPQNHDGGPFGGGQGGKVGRGVVPASVRAHLARQHPPGPHHVCSFGYGMRHGRRPASLPDICVVGQIRVLLAAGGKRQQQRSANNGGDGAARRCGEAFDPRDGRPQSKQHDAVSGSGQERSSAR
ncbi:hypothetical protein D3C85_1063890 [compost metagenome]